ncbi:hypothetical protein GW17_00014242 [Ensete ventricosum]|nr:hypothetical protein GW17_00014242 [Ensete ventricosum]
MYMKIFGKTRTARYILVRQLTGTRIDRYRVVPLRSAVGDRFRPSTVNFHRRWSVSAVCSRFKEKSTVSGRLRKKKERRRRGVPRAVLAATLLGGRPRSVAARVALASSPPAGFLLPTWERVRGDVEDFLDQSENFARSVGEAGMQKIYRCIHGSLSHLSRFAMRQINSVELRELLFKSVDDLNAPRKEGVHNEVVRHKRRYPFHDAGTSVKPTASKRPRYHQTPNVLPNPLAALQSQASYGIHRPGLNFWPPHPALTAYHRPFASFGAGYGLSPPLQHPFAASQRAPLLTHPCFVMPNSCFFRFKGFAFIAQGRLGRRDRQLPGDWARGRQSTASEFDMAAEGGPSLCGESSPPPFVPNDRRAAFDPWESQDNPVGTGYSFVEDESIFVKSDWEAATDLTTLLKKLYHDEQASSWQNSPLFIVAESYGGKFAVTAGLSIAQAIRAGELKKLKLGVSLTAAAAEASRKLSLKMYPTYLSSKASTSPDISGLMNGVIKEKLKIIPKNVRYVISFYDPFRRKQANDS